MKKKIKKLMPRVVFKRLETLYQQMENSYSQVAADIGFSCKGCPDNCCTSFFQHHTRVEWAYFIRGLNQCQDEMRQKIISRAQDYVQQAKQETALGRTPNIMCPVNEDGLCVLYSHRLMICRMHGVPTVHVRPDGRRLEFPGCFRAQESIEGMSDYPRTDRTRFYMELAVLEQGFVGPKISSLPRVNLTLAEMIVAGPPRMVSN
ncbi:hypothetical protein [Desulfonatronovibrio magnus]|uniref:hypothetical protein n=1 Tax=Desulfonatronovibrio magnus TaxID=698827 RepID=UPI0005EB45ED|nr:hypothetical protein [Desulfonatronovibrio magnus]